MAKIVPSHPLFANKDNNFGAKIPANKIGNASTQCYLGLMRMGDQNNVAKWKLGAFWWGEQSIIGGGGFGGRVEMKGTGRRTMEWGGNAFSLQKQRSKSTHKYIGCPMSNDVFLAIGAPYWEGKDWGGGRGRGGKEINPDGQQPKAKRRQMGCRGEWRRGNWFGGRLIEQ